MNNEKKNILIVVGLMLAVVVVIWGMWFISQPKSTSNLVPFAQCLATKKVTMYGAYWCSHCQNQKALFGDAFQYVPYVECTQETKLCESKGVQGFPTWFVPQGAGNDKKLEGEQTLQTLANESGCTLPVAQ